LLTSPNNGTHGRPESDATTGTTVTCSVPSRPNKTIAWDLFNLAGTATGKPTLPLDISTPGYIRRNPFMEAREPAGLRYLTTGKKPNSYSVHRDCDPQTARNGSTERLPALLGHYGTPFTDSTDASGKPPPTPTEPGVPRIKNRYTVQPGRRFD